MGSGNNRNKLCNCGSGKKYKHCCIKNTICIEQILRSKFEIFVGQTRLPESKEFQTEVDWYSDTSESVLGAIVLDHTDSDFGFVILGRDELNRFRCIDFKDSFTSMKEAQKALKITMKAYVHTGKKTFPQNDCNKLKDKVGVALFEAVCPKDKQSKEFTALATMAVYSPAKAIMSELMYHYIDVDNSFAREFQSEGFSARIWELYLSMFFNESGCKNPRAYNTPDFLLNKGELQIAIEATTVGISTKNPPIDPFEKMPTEAELKKAKEVDLPRRFLRSLRAKLKKKYWEKNHCKNIPFIIAIADFHAPLCMTWSGPAINIALHGVKPVSHFDENNQLIVNAIKSTDIDTSFFSLPESEYISAILFSSSGTLSKFNRIGRGAGFGAKNLEMYRSVSIYNPDPNADKPILKKYSINEGYTETWGEGLELYHNPNAKYPISQNFFPNIAHCFYKNNQLEAHLPPCHSFNSLTNCFQIGDNADK